MWDVITAIATNPATIAAATIIGRNIFGWVVNSVKDGKIDEYEWSQLGKTFVTIGGFAVFTYFGLGVVIDGLTIEQSTAIAAFVDVLRSQFKKK
jgi:hypothetical protein